MLIDTGIGTSTGSKKEQRRLKKEARRAKRELRRQRLMAHKSPGHYWPPYSGPNEIFIPERVLSGMAAPRTDKTAETASPAIIRTAERSTADG